MSYLNTTEREYTMPDRLKNKRVLLTQADDFMGPITAEVFTEEGAKVIADTHDLSVPGACEAAGAVRLARRAGRDEQNFSRLSASPNGLLYRFGSFPKGCDSDWDWREPCCT